MPNTPPVEIKAYKDGHDRFLIVDETVSHIGASFKDLGRTLFGFSKMEDITGTELISKL